MPATTNTMTYTITHDGDGFEKLAWSSFLAAEFPSYETFWQRHVVPLSNRPSDIQLKDDATLRGDGRELKTLQWRSFITRF